jgi:hypothetical protein
MVTGSDPAIASQEQQTSVETIKRMVKETEKRS